MINISIIETCRAILLLHLHKDKISLQVPSSSIQYEYWYFWYALSRYFRIGTRQQGMFSAQNTAVWNTHIRNQHQFMGRRLLQNSPESKKKFSFDNQSVCTDKRTGWLGCYQMFTFTEKVANLKYQLRMACLDKAIQFWNYVAFEYRNKSWYEFIISALNIFIRSV